MAEHEPTDYPTSDEIDAQPILAFFVFEHLPAKLQAISSVFARCAAKVVRQAPPGPERTVALRKLLEGKDAAVRAVLTR